MPILVTNVGLASIRDADAGGFLVNLSKFSVSSAQSAVLSVSDSALVGPIEYTGAIKSIEPVGDSTVKLTLELPVGKPAVGQWTISEIGILLDTGELFAHGVFTVPYTKSAEYSLKMIVYVTAGRIGEVINVNVTDGASLASTKYVRQLMKPVEAPGNVVAVLDQQVNDDGSYGASLAVKYGINWSYLGYLRSYVGAGVTPTVHGFNLDIENECGFWLNDREEVIVQVLTGPGAGESRKVTFTKATNRFVVKEKPFTALGTESRLTVWRNAANALPGRTPTISEDFVLGHGVNTWQKSVQTTAEGTLEIGRKSFVANSLMVYNFDSTVSAATLAKQEQFLVFVNGRNENPSNYQILAGTPGRLVFTQQPTIGSKISVVYFYLTSGIGSESMFLETTTKTTAATSSFGLPTIPDSPETVLILKDGRLAEAYEYVFVPATNSMDFLVPVASGVNVSILSFSSYAYSGNRSEFHRKDFTATGTVAEFDAGHLISDAKKVIVLLDGMYLSRDKYQVTGTNGKVLLLAIPDTGTRVSLVVYTEILDPDVYTSTGLDTGPVWVDPAGSDGKPSYMVPRTKSYLSDGSGVFEIFPVRDRSRLLMFIGGTFQDPEQYRISGTSVTHFASVPAGMRVDLISFIDEPSVGGAPNCSIANFLTTDQQAYELFIPIKSKDHLIVTVGGVYQHKAVYDLTASTQGIIFDVPPMIGEKVRVWIFDQQDYVGWRTEMYMDKSITSSGRQDYALSEAPTNEKNVLVFLNGIYQDTSTYSTNGQDLKLEYNPGSMYSGRKLVTVTFAAGAPKTRLITRKEYNELLGRVRYLEACCAAMTTGITISTQSTTPATTTSAPPQLVTTSVPPVVAGDVCGLWAVTSHDWGIISTGYIYNTAHAAAAAAQLAYENVWAEGHPGDSRGVYLLVNPSTSALGSVVGYAMVAQIGGGHVGTVGRICSASTTSTVAPTTTTVAPTTTTVAPTTTTSTSITPGNEVITATVSGGTTVGSPWTVNVFGATPYSTFYFTSGAGFTSPNISIAADGTARSAVFSYSSAGTYTITGYFSATGHVRTATASVAAATTTTTAAPTTTTPTPITCVNPADVTDTYATYTNGSVLLLASGSAITGIPLFKSTTNPTVTKIQGWYTAHANRLGEQGGIAFWMNAFEAGIPEQDILDGFIYSAGQGLAITGAYAGMQTFCAYSQASTSNQTYAISVSSTSVAEGASVTFTIRAANVPNGTVLTYSVNPSGREPVMMSASANDFAVATGTVTISNGAAVFSLAARIDFITEPYEQFFVGLKNQANVQVAVSPLVTISPSTDGGVASSYVSTDYVVTGYVV